MTTKRKLSPLGTTKVVDGVTFTATAFVFNDEVRANWITWDGGARGGIIRERSATTATGTCGITGKERVVPLPRFEKGQDECNTFAPIARKAIRVQREAYEKAKALVDAFEAENAA